jgi:isocitrate lyase
MRELLDTEPFLFGPGVYDPHGAELAMYYGFKAVYFSGYSFAIGHLGTTDMDLYTRPEIADGARRTVSALRKFQLTMAVGDPEKGISPSTSRSRRSSSTWMAATATSSTCSARRSST